MTGAYLLESEFKIYSKEDRKTALEKVLNDLGVAGSISVSMKCKAKSLRSVYTFDSKLRKLVSIYNEYTESDYYKYLICISSDDKVMLLYNSQISRKYYRNGELCCDVSSEGMFKINDTWEAVRMVECSLIDIQLEAILKDMYNFEVTTS